MPDEALYRQLLEENQRLQRENERLRRVAQDAREKLDAAMDGTGLCIWQLDVPTGKLIIFNRRWGAMLGFEPKEKQAHFDVWRDHLHPEDREAVLNAFFDHLEGHSPFYQVMHRMVGIGGKVTWVLDRGRVVERDEDGTPLRVMGTHIDITHEKEYEQQLARLAHRDPLTGLLNRTALNRRFVQARPQTVCFLDLDFFKQVNDTLGHRAGDQLLIQVGQRLRDVAGNDVAIGRLGGDEFVLLLPWPMESPAARALAEACVERISQPFTLDEGEAGIGLSMGMEAVLPGDDLAAVMLRADQAMYRVKRAGRGGYQLGDREAPTAILRPFPPITVASGV